MNTWKVILATLVIFGAGVITGALVVNLSNRMQPVAAISAPPAHPNDVPSITSTNQPNDLLHRMDRELQLSTEQHHKLERVLKESQRRTKVIRDQMSPQLKDELDRVRGEVLAVLTPDQQKRFDTLPNANNLNMYNARKQEKPEEDRKKKKKGVMTTNATPGFPSPKAPVTNSLPDASTSPAPAPATKPPGDL